MNKSIKKILESKKRRGITPFEKGMIWQGIVQEIESCETSPYWMMSLITNNIIKNNMITAMILALVIALGTGGTVMASDNARPGDLLFGIDRAVENMRLALASEEDEDSLKVRFAAERIQEVEDIKNEDRVSSDLLTEIEADVFTNETVVKLEFGDVKRVFTTNAKSRDEIIKEVSARFNMSEAQVGALLALEVENRDSRADDKTIGKKEENTIEAAIFTKQFLENAASEIKTSGNTAAIAELENLIKQFNTQADEIEGLRVDLRRGELSIRTDDNGNDDRQRFEVRTDDGRIRVEVKDGETRVKTDDNSGRSGSDDDSDDSNSNSRGGNSSVNSLLEVEADVFTDITTIKVEVNGVETNFTTTAKTREGVVAQVVQRFPNLTRAQVDAVLSFELEDRASRADDFDTDSTSRSNSSVNSPIEIEADIFTDITTVKVEINDVKTNFTTTAKTREGIVTQVAQRFPNLTRSQIDSLLNLEVENRASRPDDIDSDDNGSGRSGGSDDDNDSTDDSSGRSGSDDDGSGRSGSGRSGGSDDN